MIYRLLARGIATLHTAYALFVVLGALLVLRWPALIWVHALAILWAFATLVVNLGCPLTQWEKTFWERGGREAYAEGFLEHHFLHVFGSGRNARKIHIALGVGVVALNAAVYLAVGKL